MERMIRLWLLIIMLATTGGLAAQCEYVLRATDQYGDGWNGGGSMQIRTGTTVLQTFTMPSGSTLDIPFDFQVISGTSYNLYWSSGGTYASEMGVQLLLNGTALYTKAAGTGSAGTTLHTWTSGCTSAAPVAGCTSNTTQYPTSTFTPTCSGSAQDITTAGYATEYSMVSLTAGNTYTFSSSISSGAPTSILVAGVQPLEFVPSATGTYRLYNNTNSSCGTASTSRTRRVTCSAAASGCTNTTSAGTGAGPAAGAIVTGNCTATQYRGYTSGIVTATEYTASSSNTSDYITVRTSTSSGTVLAHGPSPLVFTTTGTASLYVHLNTNSACGTNSTTRTLSLSRASTGCTGSSSYSSYTPTCTGSPVSVGAYSAGSSYSTLSLQAGVDYTFTSSIGTDYLTITNASNAVQVHGVSNDGVIFTPPTTTTYRFHLHANSSCGTNASTRTRYVTCASSCSNSTNAGSTTGPAVGATVTGASTATQYRTFTSIANATQYTASSSTTGDFLTVRTGTSGPGTIVVAEGFSPLVFTTSATTNLYIHPNTSEACGTNSTSRTLSLGRAGAGAPCANTSNAGAITTPTLGNSYTATLTALQYRTMSPATGAQYRFSSSIAEDYITVRLSTSTGTVLAHGPSPLVVVTSATTTLYISVNADNTCSTNSTSRTLTVAREAVDPCVLSMEDANCGEATPVSIASGAGAWAVSSSCSGTTLGAEKIFKFNSGLGGTHNLAFTSGSYNYAHFYIKPQSAGCDATGWTCIGYNNYSTNGSWNFTAAANTAYYILVDNGSSSSAVSGSFMINCPPPNDLVCDAVTITCGQSLNGTTIGATNNAGASNYEGTTSCTIAQSSTRAAVWYKVVGNGQIMTASLCATSPTWDSRINVYSGASCSALTCIGGNDDNGPDCNTSQASYKWNSVSGTTYYIRVHGYSSEAAFNLTLTCQVDPCAPANILPLTCGSATSATMNGSGIHDPYSCSSTPGQERFYSFTPLGSGSYSITQNSNSAGVMRYHYKTVSSGCAGTSWNCIGSITSTGTTSTFNLTGGTAYYIIVDQGATTSGTVNFTLNCPPDNDLVCNAADISCGQTMNGSTLMGGSSGTYEYNNSCGGVSHNYSSAGVWYKVTGNGQALTASLCGTSPVWNSRINIYSGATCTGTLTCLGGNDDNGPVCTSSTQASYSWPSVNGTVYWIKVHGYSTDANFSLSLTCAPLAQGSTCADPIVASSFPYTNANTTCDKWNIYGNQCSSSYGSGANDAVYQLNISQTGTYSFELNSPSPYIGWFLKNSSNCATTSSCLANGQSGSGNTASGSYNFTSTGTYYLVVTHYYTYSSYVECAEYTLNILPPITNDNCAGGIALTVNPTIACGTSTSGTTIGATQSQTACGGNGTASHDVWYTFQATATSHVVTVTRGSLQYPAVQVFSGACSGNGAVAGNSIACESTTSSSVNEVSAVLSGLSIGSTYRVRVHSYYSGASYAGGFSICVATPSPCTVGTASPAGIQTPSCTGSASSVSGSVGTGYTRVNLTGGTPYTFSSSRTADYLTITNSTGITAYVYGPGPISWTPPGTGTDEYRFYTHSDINCGTIGTRTRYVSCPPPPPANDDCAGAVNIVPSLTCETITGTLGGATQSIPAASTCGVNTGASANDVWYKFTATANNHVVNVRATSNTDLIMAVYHGGATGICNGTYVSCMDQMYFTTMDTESLPVATVPGDVYFVRVYAYNGAASTSNTFQICVTVPAPNNSCSSMEMLTVSSDVPNNSCDNNTRVGNTAGASQDGPQPTCGGSVGPWADVWYSFNSGYNSAILTTLVPSSAVMGSLVLDLYTGSCGALTPVACYLGSDAGNPVLPVEPNTDYVLRVSTNRRNQIGGTFSICLSSPPKPSCITEAPVPAAASVLCVSGSDVILDWPEADHPSTYALLFNSAPLGGSAPALVTSPLPGSYVVLPSDPQVATSYNVGVLPPGQYVWRVVPRNGNGSPSPACTAPATTWRFTVQPVPTVTSTGTYGPVCVNGPLIPLAGAGAPSGGTGAWSGPGVSNAAPWTFNPAIAGTGTHSLSFTYTANGCGSEASTLSVIVNGLPVVNAGSYGPFCTESSDVTLLGSPAGGTWSGTGVTGDQFSPSAGTQTLTYTYADGNGCSNSDQVVITVNPAPVVDAGSYGPFCSTDANVDLVGSPTGGTWSGTGVTGNQFSPSAGTQTLTYTYDDVGGCSNSDQVVITVNPLPTVDAGNYGPVCSTDANVDLVGSPAGGTWSGTGVTGDQFSPSAGTQTLTYTYADGNGCSNSDQVVITVNPLPVVDAGSYDQLCSTDANVDLVGSPAGGTWSGTGVTGNQFSPSAGTQTLTYTYADVSGCSNSDQVVITVNPLPTVDAGSYGPVCSADANVDLVGSPTGGTWSGTGVTVLLSPLR